MSGIQKNIIKTLLLIALFMLSENMNAQTCCAAGAPIGSYLEIQTGDKRLFSFQFRYEYNNVNRLVENENRIENDPRTRYGQSFLWKLDFSLNKKLAFSAIVPFVHQSRNTISEQQSSFGIGDFSFITQYTHFKGRFRSLNISAGIKFPTGKTNHRADSQILLSPDMQSGTGSFDFIFRSSASKTFSSLPFLTSYASALFRLNGMNNDFGSTSTFVGRQFAFGDEVNSQIGARYLLTLKSGFLTPDIGLKIRWANHNLEQQQAAPNSGGYWLSLPLGVSFAPNEKKSIAFTAELPLYQKLSGLQITTAFRLGFQINYTFQKNKTDDILN